MNTCEAHEVILVTYNEDLYQANDCWNVMEMKVKNTTA